MVARVVSAGEGELRALGSPGPVGAASWPSLLGSWWRPAAALVAASAALLFVTPRDRGAPQMPSAALPLAVVTAQGDPTAVFEGLGIPADPVLALITIEGTAR